MKKILMSLLISINFNAMADQIIDESYNKVISEVEKKGNAVIKIEGFDFNNLSPEEVENDKSNIRDAVDSLNINEDKKEELYRDYEEYLMQMYYNPKLENNIIAISHQALENNILLSMIPIPKLYYPENIINYNCEGIIMFQEPYRCFEFSKVTNEYITKNINDKIMPLNMDFLSRYIIIHEYGHLLPQQTNINRYDYLLEEPNLVNIAPHSIISHIKEVYSDLFSLIILTQKGYDTENYNQVELMRNMGYILYKDWEHYSTPYIELLKSNGIEKINSLKTIKEIDVYIFNIINTIIKKNKHFMSKEDFAMAVKTGGEVLTILKDADNYIHKKVSSTEKQQYYNLLREYMFRYYNTTDIYNKK